MPNISIVVPVYKVEKYLNRCVDSILSQTYTDFDLILVDDGSPDNCGQICDEYAKKDARIHVIHRENGGLSAARNSGIDWSFNNSSSEWIMFIDSDDWINHHTLEYMMNVCKFTNVKTVMCEYTKDLDTPKIDFSEEKYYVVDSIDLYNNPQKYNTFMIISAWAKLYYKPLLKNIRYPEGKKYEDGFTTHKLMLQNDKTALLNLELYHYFVREDSIMQQSWDYHSLDGIEATKERMAYFKQHQMDIAYKNEINHYLHDLANNYRLCGISDGNKKYRPILKSELKKALRHYRKITRINYSSLYCSMYKSNFFYRIVYYMIRIIEIARGK